MRWNKNGCTVTVRINLFAVGDDSGDLCTADRALTLISPALSLTHWQALFADPQLPQAHYWRRWCRQPLQRSGVVDCPAGDCGVVARAEMAAYVRPSAVALRHSPCGFATSARCSLLTEGCFMTISRISLRQWTNWVLGWAYPGGESAFLLWILAAVLSEKRLLQQLIVLDSLGYSRWQCLNWLLLPSVASALAMAMLAIVAWSLSVVDVAIILGRGNP